MKNNKNIITVLLVAVLALSLLLTACNKSVDNSPSDDADLTQTNLVRKRRIIRLTILQRPTYPMHSQAILSIIMTRLSVVS